MNQFKYRNSLQLLLFMIIITLLVGVGVGVTADAEKTYIEFVFDASFSMNESAEKSNSRMDVLKRL